MHANLIIMLSLLLGPERRLCPCALPPHRLLITTGDPGTGGAPQLARRHGERPWRPFRGGQGAPGKDAAPRHGAFWARCIHARLPRAHKRAGESVAWEPS